MNDSNDTPTTRHPMSRALPKRPYGPMRSPARALGWFSIALGVAELAMPRAMARAAGLPPVGGLVRFYGLREIGVGIGLLSAKDPAPWLWGRVAGDALDLATVGAGAMAPRGDRTRALVSLAILAGVTALDAATARGAIPKERLRSGRDYSGRSGFPRPPSEMRGLAARRAPEPKEAAREPAGIA